MRHLILILCLLVADHAAAYDLSPKNVAAQAQAQAQTQRPEVVAAQPQKKSPENVPAKQDSSLAVAAVIVACATTIYVIATVLSER
jgi:hypothetical protein